jgi:hypothetical protein
VIVYGAKRVGGKLLLRRWFKKRTSDKNKRLDLDMSKLRKKWWHFRTRWD